MLILILLSPSLTIVYIKKLPPSLLVTKLFVEKYTPSNVTGVDMKKYLCP
jgi:hypothetical protein